MAVVGDLDELEAATLDEDMDVGGGGVEAVLEENLDDGERPLDDTAGGDSVDNGFPQALDFERLHSNLNVFHALTLAHALLQFYRLNLSCAP